MNEAVEKFITNCDISQQSQDCISRNITMSWPLAPANFYRVYIDF